MVEVTLARQPDPGDSMEQRIRRILDETLGSTTWAREAFSQARSLQTNFLTSALGLLSAGKAIKVRSLYERIISDLSDVFNTKIGEGEENLDELSNQAFIVVTNHLGLPKMTRIKNKQRAIPVELDEIEPFPIRHASLIRVSEKTNVLLHETSLELPGVLLEIQQASQVVTIPVEGKGRTQMLAAAISDLIEQNRQRVFVMYPEGGTSGKRNWGRAYDLELFHSGAFVVALSLNLPVIPVCQFFNPKSGIELYVLSPIYKIKDPKVATQSTAETMQSKLNSLTR